MRVLVAVLLLSQVATAVPSIETPSRTEAAGYVAGWYFTMDAATHRCATSANLGEAWRTATMATWIESNKAILSATRAYYQRLFAEREAAGGKARRERYVGMIRSMMQAEIGPLVDQGVDKLVTTGGCESIRQDIVSGRFEVALAPADRADLIEAAAPFVDPKDMSYRPLPFSVSK
jgi:hypothetical protein